MMKSLLLSIDLSLPLKDPVLIFSIVLFIILLAPIILRKFRIPSIIGLIIAGVIIGPYGLNVLRYDSSIELFGMVGLLYIMFLAGLDLEMNEFLKNRGRSAVFGLCTFILPFGMGVPVCHYLLHFGWVPSVLISSMFATHTLVSYPIASRLGITKNQVVTIAVGGTIITDTLVLLILAVITGAARGTLNQAFWLRLGISIVVFVLIVFLLFPLIARWFFRNIKADNTTHYIFVLAMVFLAGMLAKLAGVEAIIGAFMAGLALNRLIPHTSPLMNRIDFVGNTLFIPFFLLSVGMRVDLRVFLHGSGILVLAGVLLVIAFLGKWLAALIVQKIYGYSMVQRRLLFGLTSSRAAATLAVILVGFEMGIVNETILNGTVILILITCLVSSFITENAGRKLAIVESQALPEMEESRENILVPISNPETIEQLMDFAIMLKDPRQRTPIYALSIVKDDEEAGEKVLLSNKMLEKVIKHASATDSPVQIITRVDLNVVSGITRAAKEVTATDLIMGWSSRISTTDRLFGTKLGSLLLNNWQNIYVSRFLYPLNTTRKVVLIIPGNAEYEIGFAHCIRKVEALSRQAGADILLCTGKKTQDAFMRELGRSKNPVQVQFRVFDDLEDFLVISRSVSRHDLLIIISARKGTLSYHTFLDNIPVKLNRHFRENNFILIYPEQNMVEVKESGLQGEDLTLAPIQEQIENISKLGRAVKKMFRGGPRQDKEDPGGDTDSPSAG
ncbi:cation:proton antiporter [Compostibacter hankyongensis]|uniref:Cation:proton antiporter n=1 Tax=Compostibacter hankyongensis TaxID=1007089 RepID=A0ABP8G9H6_9BACT